MSFTDTILQGDVLEQLKTLPADLVDCVVTSPPYWSLRDYGVEGQIGMEQHPQEYINKIVGVFHEIKRVLKPTGTVFLNLGDSYYTKSGSNFKGSNDSYSAQADKVGIRKGNELRELYCDGKWLQSKQKLMLPERIAIAMQDDGWILRNSIIWYKPNHMPASVTDRLTGAYESVFFFTKNRQYHFNLDGIRKHISPETMARVQRNYKTSPKTYNNNFGADNHKKWAEKVKHDIVVGREGNFAYSDPLHVKPYNHLGANPGDVWSLTTEPNKIAHFATFPTKLVRRCLNCGCPKEGLVLDPFSGSGTTLWVARKMALHYLGIELKPEYIEIAKKRLANIPSRLDSFICEPKPQLELIQTIDVNLTKEVEK
jgi:DNA modification methylase